MQFLPRTVVRAISFSPPLRPLDRTKEYERTTAEGRFEESTTATRSGSRQRGWIDPARSELKLNSKKSPTCAAFCSSSSNSSHHRYCRRRNARRDKRYVFLSHISRICCARGASINVHSVQSFSQCASFHVLSSKYRTQFDQRNYLDFSTSWWRPFFQHKFLLSLT